jgi:FMN phosphatase YigB (HAD superfamily)
MALAKHIGVPLRGWMVGDGLETDVEAGRRAGLRTAWITDHPRADAAADLVVGDVPGFAAAVLSA